MEWNLPFGAVVALRSMTRTILTINGKSSSIFFYSHSSLRTVAVSQCNAHFNRIMFCNSRWEKKSNRSFRSVFSFLFQFFPLFCFALHFAIDTTIPLEISIVIWFTRIRQLISIVHAHVLINFLWSYWKKFIGTEQRGKEQKNPF